MVRVQVFRRYGSTKVELGRFEFQAFAFNGYGLGFMIKDLMFKL